jgi:hypothetical protein
MYYWISFLLIVPFTFCEAAIYQQSDSTGNITYSDVALSDEAAIMDNNETLPNKIYSPQTTPISVVSIKKNSSSTSEPHIPYTVFTIASPLNGETFQNAVSIPVSMTLEPELQKGDTIQLYVDGQTWHAPSASTQLSLYEIERGTHQVKAKVIDSTKTKIQESNNVTIYVQRTSAVFKKKVL